ncbi:MULTISPECIES: hypothetical protein [Rhodococcus]|jgi:hypothetical protein|uniref:Uncharacterized protein n=2 Tax=Rhodococcus TaxID=1827 RepID=A0ABU4AUP6_9NOCA|nr:MULTISPECIES: hypothetical protein [Rhodococcus]KAA0927973.1 hypothetical protein FQ188_02535 [Rhodococcus sp. ANT_H53B]MDI9925540.1 hypothetical protein [Rhodococcus sp. IEGM 1341]MDV6229961.1 hypothetical protein [Rhodococcus cercidiphylli]MDV6300967.1 hypothetical protein [Rhodococcus cerastii]MDV8053652.1 hypothetical protein [Rhodococcus sp. IEGM 1343]
MLPLLARKYLYRYLIVAIGLPILARLLAFAGQSLEKRTGNDNFVSRGLKSAGRFAQKRADKSQGKQDRKSRSVGR